MAINRSHDELRKLKRKAILESVLPFLKNEPLAEAHVMKEQEGTAGSFPGKNTEIHPAVFYQGRAEGKNPACPVFQTLDLPCGISIDQPHLINLFRKTAFQETIVFGKKSFSGINMYR